MGIRERYEQHHKVTITDDAVQAAADLSIRYITDRHLPDKAIDLIDEAASRVRLRHSSAPPGPARGAEGPRPRSPRRRTRRSTTRSTRRPRRCARPRPPPRDGRHAARRVAVAGRPASSRRVDEEEIAQVVAMWTGIPVTRIAQEESERLLHMEDALHDRVIGQQEAIEIVSKAVRRARAGLKDPKRPIGSFIFLGPDRRREDGARQGARRVHVRQRGRAHQDRHERVHGAPQRQPARRGASRLRRLRRGRPADRGRPPQELLRDPARRGREGAPGGLQHPAPDPRGRAPVRRQGPPGRLPELHHHHDLATSARSSSRPTPASASASRATPTRPAPRARTSS